MSENPEERISFKEAIERTAKKMKRNPLLIIRKSADPMMCCRTCAYYVMPEKLRATVEKDREKDPEAWKGLNLEQTKVCEKRTRHLGKGETRHPIYYSPQMDEVCILWHPKPNEL